MARQYVVSVSGQANTAASDSIVVESPAGAGTGAPAIRLKRLIIMQPGTQTTAGLRVLQVARKTTAGTAGAVTPASTDGIGTFGGVCRAKPTTPGTTGAVLLSIPVLVPAAAAAFVPIDIPLGDYGITASDGITNGLALIDPGAAGAAGFAASLIFEELSH